MDSASRHQHVRAIRVRGILEGLMKRPSPIGELRLECDKTSTFGPGKNICEARSMVPFSGDLNDAPQRLATLKRGDKLGNKPSFRKRCDCLYECRWHGGAFARAVLGYDASVAL
jgi:hypothetical protein